MVPWTLLREPCLGWMRTGLTSEVTLFNSAIRFRKVKLWAFQFSTFCLVPLLLLSIWPSGKFNSAAVLSRWTIRNLLFCRCSSFSHCNMSRRQQACPFPAGVFFLVSGEVQHFDLIPLNLYLRFMRMWPERHRSRFGSNTRLSRIELKPFNVNLLNLLFLFSSPTSPPFGP